MRPSWSVVKSSSELPLTPDQPGTAAGAGRGGNESEGRENAAEHGSRVKSGERVGLEFLAALEI